MGALPDRLPGFQHVENDELRATLRCPVGRARAAEEGLAPVADVRRDGARRAHRAVRRRREPGAVGGRSPPDGEAAPGPRHPGRPGHLPDRDGRDRRRGVPRRGGLGRVARARSPTPSGASSSCGQALKPPGEARDDLRIIFDLAKRMGAAWGEPDRGGRLERGPGAVARAPRHELRAARGPGRNPVAVLGRRAPRRAVPALAAVGGPGAGQPGAVRAGRARPAGRPRSTTTSRSA